jgi:transposase InsO family protein
MSDKYAAITAHWGQFPVPLLCRALDVSVSGYYEAKVRIAHGPSARAQADERLLVLVRAAFAKSHGRYGAPRVLRALRAQDVHVGKHRIARVMRTDGLQARAPRAFVRTTDSRHAEPVAPNRLARHFALADHPIPHRTWVGDMTYIPTRSGWLYLAVLIDLATRLVVGWATSASMSTLLPLRALQQAIARHPPAPGVTQHTDRGSQYASAEYRAALAAQHMQQSMSRKGDCWDNAVAESFFATLEHELLANTVLHSHRDANVALTEFIERWYNEERQHSTLGYVSPQQYENQLRQMARAA